jgi:putative ABC transport system substrate-binding protein
MLAHKDGERIRLVSRNGRDHTARFADIAAAIARLPAPSPFTSTHRQRIIALAAAHRLPTVYPLASYAEAGGLIAYGVNTPAMWQEAASYVDRILRGENPGELPVQEPQHVDIVVNLVTAKALGLTIPPAFLTRASKVIQ